MVKEQEVDAQGRLKEFRPIAVAGTPSQCQMAKNLIMQIVRDVRPIALLHTRAAVAWVVAGCVAHRRRNQPTNQSTNKLTVGASCRPRRRVG